MSEQLEPIIADDVVWGKAYYEMHEVDAIIAQKNKEIAELKATPHTDNSDVIEKMATEISELKEERRWRKFPDEKPTKDIKFLVINEKGFMQCCYYSPILKEFQIPVTHWMPLPSVPKEVK